MDIVSQLIMLSPTWQNIMLVGIANINGTGAGGGQFGMFESSIDGIYWNRNPFLEEPHDWIPLQIQLANVSLIYTKLLNIYNKKDICKTCIELDSIPNDPRITILHPRIKKCPSCNAQVSKLRYPEKRIPLYIHNKDRTGKELYYIDDKSFSVITLATRLHEMIMDRITIKSQQKNK